MKSKAPYFFSKKDLIEKSMKITNKNTDLGWKLKLGKYHEFIYSHIVHENYPDKIKNEYNLNMECDDNSSVFKKVKYYNLLKIQEEYLEKNAKKSANYGLRNLIIGATILVLYYFLLYSHLKWYFSLIVGVIFGIQFFSGLVIFLSEFSYEREKKKSIEMTYINCKKYLIENNMYPKSSINRCFFLKNKVKLLKPTEEKPYAMIDFFDLKIIDINKINNILKNNGFQYEIQIALIYSENNSLTNIYSGYVFASSLAKDGNNITYLKDEEQISELAEKISSHGVPYYFTINK